MREKNYRSGLKIRVAGVVPVPAGPSEVVDLGIRVAFANLELSKLPVALSSFASMGFREPRVQIPSSRSS